MSSTEPCTEYRRKNSNKKKQLWMKNLIKMDIGQDS